MQQQGLVRRDKEGWKLTDAGREEAREAATRVVEVLEAARKISQSSIWRWPGLAIEEEFGRYMVSMREALVSSAAEACAALDMRELYQNVIQPHIFQSLAPPPDFMEQFTVLSVPDQLTRDAMRPLMDVASHYRSLLADTVSSKALAGVADMIARNNTLVAGALENMQGLSVLAQLRDMALDQLLYAGVADHVRNVTLTYKELLDSRTQQITSASPQLAPRFVWQGMTVPTVTVSSYTRALRWKVHGEQEELPPLQQLDFEEGASGQLDDLLADLNPRFVDMWHGSWQALQGNNPDRGRHAAVSFRELLRQFLDLVVPGGMASGDAPGSKMKSAVRQLLGNSESSAEFAVAVADAVYSLHGYLSKVTHTNYSHTQAVRAALVTGEGLLLFLLVHRSTAEPE
jgi:hypothetical protein